jgi:hypothetical protein
LGFGRGLLKRFSFYDKNVCVRGNGFFFFLIIIIMLGVVTVMYGLWVDN